MLNSFYLGLVSLAIWLTALPCLANPYCKRALTASDFHARRLVTETDVRENLIKLRERCGSNCERDGLFGPGSMMWEVSKVPFLALFAETELYLQLAHPVGAQGVADHSRLLTEPIRRFQSTFDFIWRMTYGSFSEAEKLALTLNKIHSRITGVVRESAGAYSKGDIYSANDSEALLWVHATHWYAVMKTYEVFVRPLSYSERDAFIADTKKYAMLLGIAEDRIPGNWLEFKSYFDGMLRSGELTYTVDARRLEQHFRELSRAGERDSRILWLVRKYADVITSSTLPQNLASQFDLQKGLIKQTAYRGALVALRLAYQRLPEWVQVLPLYRIAMARVEGRAPDSRDELAHRILVGK